MSILITLEITSITIHAYLFHKKRKKIDKTLLITQAIKEEHNDLSKQHENLNNELSEIKIAIKEIQEVLKVKNKAK